MSYQRKIFFIHYCGDSNYYPEVKAQSPRLFSLRLYQLFSASSVQAVNLVHCGFLLLNSQVELNAVLLDV